MATNYLLFDLAEKVELLAAKLYQELAVRYSSNVAIHDLFTRLSAEEVQHASRVRLLAARYRQSSRILGARPPEPVLLERLVEEATAAVAAVVAGAWDGDAGRARRRASELELRFAEGHAEALAKDAHPDVRRFFEQLSAQDRAHQALLEG